MKINQTYTVGAIMAAGILFLMGCRSDDYSFDDIPKPVYWTTAKRIDQGISRNLSGVVQPVEMTALSFEVGGSVEVVNLELGESFQPGQILATLEKNTFELQVRQRKGELLQAQARLHEVQADFNRQKVLVQEGAVSQKQFDAAQSALESTINQVEIAEARLQIALEDLEDTNLAAPYSGHISRRMVEPSQNVSPGQPVFQIQGDGGLEVSVLVPETIIGEIRIGSRHEVHFPGVDVQSVPVEVAEVGSRATAANAFPVVLRILNHVRGLRPGMTAEVAFRFPYKSLTESSAGDYLPAETPIYPLPLSAIQAGEQGTTYIFLVSSDGRVAYRHQVSIADFNGSFAFVEGDLSSGDKVITSGAAFLRDGQQVQLIGEGIQTLQD